MRLHGALDGNSGRGIGDKRPLNINGRFQASQQIVERGHQRTGFIGHPRFGERRQRIRAPRLNRLRQLPERPQPSTDQPPDQQTEHRQQDKKWFERA